MDVAGMAADVCPFCGDTLRVNRTDVLVREIVRYMVCDSVDCRAVFLSTQPKAVLLRVVTDPAQIPVTEIPALPLVEQRA